MAMVVKNNLSALNTLNRLNANNSELAKSLKKVSSGMRITGVGDDASAYSISERMQVRIRGLGQCNANTETGGRLLAVAEGAVDQQIQIMQKLREIALKSSDDTYAQVDRDVLQSETTQLLMQLNEISYETNYNGIPLLSGLVPGTPITSFDTSTGISANDPNKLFVPQPTTNHSQRDGGGRNITGYVPTPYSYSNGPYYDPSSTPVLGQINFTYTNAGTNAFSSGSTIYDATGNNAYTVRADTNGVLSAYDAATGTYTPIVDNAGNTYNVQTSALVPGTGFVPYEKVYSQVTAPSDGDVVTLSRSASANVTSYTYETEPHSGKGTLIQVNGNEFSASNWRQTLDFSWADPPASIPNDLDGQGISCLCNGCDQFVSFRFDTSRDNASSAYYTSSDGSELYLIGVSDATSSANLPQMLLNGIKNAANRPIDTMSGSNETAFGTLRHKINLYKTTDASGNDIVYLDKPDTSGLALLIYNGSIGDLVTKGGKKPYQDFFIQGDTKSSQETRLELPNTTLNTLFPAEDSELEIDPQPKDYPNPWPSEYLNMSDIDREYYSQKYHTNNEDAIRRAKWRDEVWPYPRKGALASASCVRTRQNANRFLGDIDQALKYLLHAATNLGSQSQRMVIMNGNIVTAHENTQGAESTIRDADMAKEMVTYTKNNVLTQTAQSMLSQANQNTGGVLDLLQ